MPYVVGLLVLVALIALPGLWARHVLERYGRDEYFSGTGIDLAGILVRDLNLDGVRVETTELGDHYDPAEKVVRLNIASTGKRSLTAVVVAAHEVGHALQDQSGDGLLRFRTGLVMFGIWAERIGAAAIMVAPLLGAALQVPPDRPPVAGQCGPCARHPGHRSSGDPARGAGCELQPRPPVTQSRKIHPSRGREGGPSDLDRLRPDLPGAGPGQHVQRPALDQAFQALDSLLDNPGDSS